jgi:hypothetical protein
MSRGLIIALVLIVTGAGYVISTARDASSPVLQPAHVPPDPGPQAVGRGSDVPVTAVAKDESHPTPAAAGSSARMSDEERAVAIKHAISKSMAEERDRYADELVKSGLAAADSARIAQRFADGVADCIFEAARTEHEAQGATFKEFLDGVEIVWSQPVEQGIRDLSGIQSGAALCVATVSQQAGIALPTNFGPSANDIVERLSVGLEQPPWAEEMEDRIHEHIASHADLELTGVLVECREEGCHAMLVGSGIRIFDLDFDQFAAQNGFRHAVLGGDANRRFVWLQR